MYWLSPEKFGQLQRETENIRRVELVLESGEPFRPAEEQFNMVALGDLFSWLAFRDVSDAGTVTKIANCIAVLLPRAAALDFRIALGLALALMSPAEVMAAASSLIFLQPPTDLRALTHLLYDALDLPERVGGAVILLA